MSVRVWSGLEFAAGRSEWQALLRRTSADPLFMSWEWQSRWWRLHGEALRAQLRLLAAYDGHGRLVGLAPLYGRNALHRWGLRGRRLEILGSSFRSRPQTTFSEYLDFIVDRSCEAAVLRAFAAHLLAEPDWGDLVIAHTRGDGPAARMVQQHLLSECLVRRQDEMTAHVLPMPSRFEDYLAALKAGVRRKIWNRRKRLPAVSFRFAEAHEIEPTLRLIQGFQAARWGEAAAGQDGLRFHIDFAAAMAQQDALRMSLLCEDGEPISAMYNIELGGTEYNLQSGFSPRVASLSPSYLHFGYCLENAARRGVRAFDFLAGGGRSREYKQDFATGDVDLVTLQAIREPRLQRIYGLYDGTPRWVRRLAGAARH